MTSVDESAAATEDGTTGDTTGETIGIEEVEAGTSAGELIPSAFLLLVPPCAEEP